jgi:hypothetical protein
VERHGARGNIDTFCRSRGSSPQGDGRKRPENDPKNHIPNIKLTPGSHPNMMK